MKKGMKMTKWYESVKLYRAKEVLSQAAVIVGLVGVIGFSIYKCQEGEAQHQGFQESVVEEPANNNPDKCYLVKGNTSVEVDCKTREYLDNKLE
jgi:hypothetical protein